MLISLTCLKITPNFKLKWRNRAIVVYQLKKKVINRLSKVLYLKHIDYGITNRKIEIYSFLKFWLPSLAKHKLNRLRKMEAELYNQFNFSKFSTFSLTTYYPLITKDKKHVLNINKKLSI